MVQGRRGTVPGMGEFAPLFLINYSLPVPCFALKGSGCKLKGRFSALS